MMELKFRAWNGKEISEPFVSDDIKLHFDGPEVWHCIEEYRPLSKYSDSKGLMRWLVDSDCKETVIMQSSGTCDKNGKEIYYNCDVFKFKFYDSIGDKSVELVGTLSFNDYDQRAEIDIINNYEYVCLWFDIRRMSDFEVVGNIYENTELLKDDQI
jgi:uncharacterized phage protein (TIGR01671 family)